MKKNFLYIIILTAAISISPRDAFSMFDGGFYGGYSLLNKSHINSTFVRPYGFDFGFIAHYNLDAVPKILMWGIGAYYNMAILNYKISSATHDFTRHNIGIDTYLSLVLSKVVHPYIRFSASIWEDAEGETSYFQSMLAGGGLEFPIYWKILVFGEYVFNFKVDSVVTDAGHTVHVGIRVKI